MDHSQMDHGSHIDNFNNLWLVVVVIIFGLIGLYFYFKKSDLDKKNTINLFKYNWIKRSVSSGYFIFSVRLVPALVFVFILATGFFGSVRGNLAAPFTWLFWWSLLIFFVAFAGKIFCMACPWDFFANLFQFGLFYKKSNKASSLGLKWPKKLSNIYLASLFFILFTWFELVGVATNSFATAALGLGIVSTAIIMALIFKNRPFCRYLCPIGRISGIYAQFSPLEIRPNDLSICNTCKTKECVKGTVSSTPCPTMEVPFKLKENTYCTLCTECIKSCDKDNMVLKLRPAGSDLYYNKSEKKDEGILIILIIVLTFFHGLTMTPTWFKFTDSLQSYFNISYTFAFSILMTLIILVSLVVFYLFFKSQKTLNGLFALIPLALGYHFGHNLMHLMSESLNLVSYLNDPFGWGHNVFGLKDFKAYPLMSHASSRILQFVCIIWGFFYSVKVMKKRVSSQFASHYVLSLSLALIGLWLIMQPMIMRTVNG